MLRPMLVPLFITCLSIIIRVHPEEMYAQSPMSGHSSVRNTSVRTCGETTEIFKHRFFHADTPFLLGAQSSQWKNWRFASVLRAWAVEALPQRP